MGVETFRVAVWSSQYRKLHVWRPRSVGNDRVIYIERVDKQYEYTGKVDEIEVEVDGFPLQVWQERVVKTTGKLWPLRVKAEIDWFWWGEVWKIRIGTVAVHWAEPCLAIDRHRQKRIINIGWNRWHLQVPMSYTGDPRVIRLMRYFNGSCKAVLAGLKIICLTVGA